MAKSANDSKTFSQNIIIPAENNINADDANKELREMLEAGVHFGYSRSSCHPKIKPFLFGVRNDIEIFDLEKTHIALHKAKKFLENLAKEGKKILIIGTKPGIRQLVEQASIELNMPYVSERWLGGTLTNFKVIKGRIDYFENLRQKKSSGELNKYTKKEISRFSKELSKIERFFGGLVQLKELPSAVLIVDPKKEKTALRENIQMSIPIIAIMNSDTDPTEVTYPIPANDTSPISVKYLLGHLVKAYKGGVAKIVPPSSI